MDGPLTTRQALCVRLAGEGLQNKDIAARIKRSERTVENHLAQAFKALGVNDRRAAARVLNKYSEQELSVAEQHDIPPSRSVAAGQQAGLDTDPIQGRRTLYSVYAALGAWRLPPRLGGRRIGPILVTALLLALCLGMLSQALRSCAEFVDVVRGRPV